MKVGTMVPCVHSVEMKRMAVEGLSQLGLDSLWLPDHLMGFIHPRLWDAFAASAALPDPDAFLDPFCVAAALGGSSGLPVGICVTDATRRRGPDLARAGLTLNDICAGGFILGIGAGEAESTTRFGYDWSRPIGNLKRALGDIPTDESRVRGARMTALAQDNERMVVDGLGGAIEGNIEALLAVLAPDVVVHEPEYLPYGGDYHGHEGFLTLQQRASEVLDVSSLKIHTAVANDERVVLLMTTAFVDGPGEQWLTEHWQVRDGKVVDIRVFWFGTPPEAGA